ncbi:MAG: discoidin domain-containing protein [Bacteroidaceae bacterium]|nr:discoidin domain-containing protein [Bacteroidaceae bacterium]
MTLFVQLIVCGSVFAADPPKAEYDAAIAAVKGGSYYITTEVDGVKYYVTKTGYLAMWEGGSAQDFENGLFEISQVSGGTLYDVGFLIEGNTGQHFSNTTLVDGKANLHPNTGVFCLDGNNNRDNWERQVFFMNEEGKIAIRSCNTTFGDTYWVDAGRAFWTYEIDEAGDVVYADYGPMPCYSYDPAYVWKLEEYSETPEQIAALTKVQAWPGYVQSAVGLVKDYNKFYSNAKEPYEGSYEALLDGDYTTFFHSAWSIDVADAHYLQVELSKATQKFEFYYKKRLQNNNNRPTVIVISASNDGETFAHVKTIDSGLPTDAAIINYFSDKIDLGAAYKYVRFTVMDTNNHQKRANNDYVFFTFSEFYLFPEAVAELAPIYNTYASALAGDLTDDNINQINEADKALKSQISTVTVTYVLTNGTGGIIDQKEVVQKPYTDVEIPTTWASNSKFFDYVADGTIGNTDCTITIVRTLKAGYVGALSQLSNSKAYNIICDRGAMLTKDGTIASTSHSDLTNADPAPFAIINYDGKYFLYSKDDAKFVLNNGSLSDKLVNGEFDAIVMDLKTIPYFMFSFKVDEGTSYGVNTNGTGNLWGIVINDWMNADPGNQYYMIEATDFDPTAAIAALDAYFIPFGTVTYVVKDEFGNTIFTSDPEPVEQGSSITTLPDKYKRAYYTYSEGTEKVTDPNTVIEFTATWDGPFEISADFANAHWYNMAVRSTWYITSAVKDSDGAYKAQNANTMALDEDSYQWAFIGDGYNGFKIINKAEGEGKSFGYTDANKANAGIPTVMDDAEGHHAWEIVASTNTTVPAGSFCLNVPGTTLYVNQYGGAGGSVKFWDGTYNVSDPGSAFTVFDISTNIDSVIDDVDWTILQTAYSEMDNGKGWNRKWTFDTESHSSSGLGGVKLSNGRVIGIDLSSNNLTGSFPFVLLSLPYLETLNVSGNQLAGDIGLMMTAFRQKNPTMTIAVQKLNVSNNKFSGNVGLFANCLPNLKSLDASGNCLEDIYPMIPATVTSLDISRQTISRVVPLYLDQLSVADIATKMPSILLYDHQNQTFKTDINLSCTTPDESWGMTMVYNNGQLSFPYVSEQNTYYGENGDTLNVAVLNYDGTREGSTFRISLGFDEGDGNFDGQVNVLDLQTAIIYIMEKYKTRPYNFTAANLWKDNLINVQDVIRLVDLLMNVEPAESASSPRRKVQDLDTDADASIFIQNGRVMLNSMEPVAALDLFLNDASSIKVADDLERMGMSVISKKASDGLHIIAYSMNGACIPSGISVIGIVDTNAATVRSVMLSDSEANPISVSLDDVTTSIEFMETAGDDANAIYDLQGRKVNTMFNKGIYIKNRRKIAK